jgi:hypothetical protein
VHLRLSSLTGHFVRVLVECNKIIRTLHFYNVLQTVDGKTKEDPRFKLGSLASGKRNTSVSEIKRKVVFILENFYLPGSSADALVLSP